MSGWEGSWDDRDDGYDLSDPKSAGFAERAYEKADHDRKAAKEGRVRDWVIAAGAARCHVCQPPYETSIALLSRHMLERHGIDLSKAEIRRGSDDAA